MERIISYDEIPESNGETIYITPEVDPRLYINLLTKGYRIINNITNADDNTIYVTGRRQSFMCETTNEYKAMINAQIMHSFTSKGIQKPKTVKFSYEDLLEHKYKLPFVLKNENQNGGREKFLIQTEQDYENLIYACELLINKNILLLANSDPIKYSINYDKYLDINFRVQEYIPTPSEYNTTLRLLTTPYNNLLYASLKYNKREDYIDDTTLLGYLLSEIYPLSTKSIVSNTLSGGLNILVGEHNYSKVESLLLKLHQIDSSKYESLVNISKEVHSEFNSELGIICGFDFIYDINKEEWFLLEYHSRPMVGDYSIRQGINYRTEKEKLTAEGRVRATALSLSLKRTR